MGASGEDTSVAPGVALVVSTGEATTARIGSAPTGLTATGTITVKATHDGDFSAEAKSVAAGSTAVGVSIALNIVLDWSTLAEVARDVSGTSVEVSAESATNSGGEGRRDRLRVPTRATRRTPTRRSSRRSPTTRTRPASDDEHAPDRQGRRRHERRHRARATARQSSQGGDWTAAASASPRRSASTGSSRRTRRRSRTARTYRHERRREGERRELDAARARSRRASSASVDGSHVAAAVGVNFADVTNNATVGQDARRHRPPGSRSRPSTPDGKTNDLIVWGLAGSGGASQDNGGASVAAVDRRRGRVLPHRGVGRPRART